jgi:hypothetical protein
MAAQNGRSATEVRHEIEQERARLVDALASLRGEVSHTTERLRAKLPLAIAGVVVTGFVVAGGIGATMRYFARRGR